MSRDRADDAAYRPCVGIMLIDQERRVFVALRGDTEEEAWQMPQGGVDRGETPKEAALRELHEETGISSADLLAETTGWLQYDVPPDLRPRSWRGRFRGQRLKWFLMRFTGTEDEIDLAHHGSEFVDWRWVAPEALPGLIVAFKRPVYEAVLAEFAPWLSADDGSARTASR
jgi:putative (di)nucleoside polyphosphate hydrolase